MEKDPNRSTIFLIEEIWIDNLENRDAYGYSSSGFVQTLEQAENMVFSGGKCNKDECWAFSYEKEMPTRYRYKELMEIVICD